MDAVCVWGVVWPGYFLAGWLMLRYVDMRVRLAKIENTEPHKIHRPLPPVMPAPMWALILVATGALGMGAGCGVMYARWASPDPVMAKNCSGCAARCKCMNDKCDCPAQTEEELKKRADVVVPPDTDQAISAFGHPWATDKRL